MGVIHDDPPLTEKVSVELSKSVIIHQIVCRVIKIVFDVWLANLLSSKCTVPLLTIHYEYEQYKQALIK